MANELENTVETNGTVQNETKDDTALQDLQARIKALESENGKLKQSVTNASADASKWKKQYQEKLSAEEKAQQEQAEQTAAMQQELEMLRSKERVASFSAELVAPGIGMDAETARTVAEALNAGETDKVFSGIREFIKAHDKAIHEAGLRNNQTLHGGKVENTVTKAEFDRMGYREMVQFQAEHPDLYNEYMNKRS